MLEGYIGQKDRLSALEATIRANKLGRKLPHMLFLGSSGRGKTKLASEVARETGTHMVVLHCPSVENKSDVTEKILEAEGGILFLDEVHALPRSIAEDIYTVTDDGVVNVVEETMEYTKTVSAYLIFEDQMTPGISGEWIGPGSYWVGANPKRVVAKKTITLPRGITIIGATTDESLLPPAFLSRLSQLKVYLRPYTTVELATIAALHAKSVGAKVTPKAAVYLAERSRSTPRRVIQLTERAVDFSFPKSAGITHAKEALAALGVDGFGLEEPHRAILQALTLGPMSRTGLAQTLGLTPTNLNLYWGDLLEQGLVRVTTRHEITEKGAEAIGA